MRVLLFTHEQDIDGLGCAALANISNLDYDLVLCKTFELDEKIKKEFDKERIEFYDEVIITDLCPKEETLEIIDKDELLHRRFKVLDHHKTAEIFNHYDFVTVVSENDETKQSGTSLFYQYLKDNHLINESYVIDKFVELTRQYDTWDWYKNKNLLARKLHIIFESKGIEYYLKMIDRIISNENRVILSDEEENIIETYDNKLLEEINEMLKCMIVQNLEIENRKFRVGYIRTLYKYRNDIADVIKSNNKNDIDAIGMIITDKDSVSYRSIKDIDVSIIAVYFGGTGHKNAASNPKDNDNFQYILKLFK